VIALFHFRGLLLVWGMTISKSLGSLLVTREGEVCMKDDDHQMHHPRGHLGDRTSAKGTRGCAWRDDQFGRGQNTVLGWKQVKKVGITYFSFVFTIFFSL